MDFRLIQKKINGTLTSEEENNLTAWINESDSHKAYFDNVIQNQTVSIEDIDIDEAWNSIEPQLNISKPKSPSYWKYAVAASIVLLLMIGVLNRDEVAPEKYAVEDSTILIGSDKANLTLEDGSKILLENGDTYNTIDFKSDGKHLVYNHNEEDDLVLHYNYLTTPSGGQYQLELSDGTMIWLNANSQIKYPIAFKKGEPRIVELLYGEAYFDVSPSEEHHGDHFIVKTKTQEIEVLGTEFNVKAYKDEAKITSSLVEGKIVLRNNTSFETTLIPGDEVIVDLASNEVTQEHPEDLEEITAWKNGQFIFNRQPLSEIMKTLSRWYTIEVKFENDTSKEIKFSGVLDRNKHLFELLKNFESTGEVSFELDKNKISIQ
ncbi:MAG: FecR family protein [bacterium]